MTKTFELDLPTPPSLAFLFPVEPDGIALGDLRYRVVYGGRGSGKSWQMARALLLHAHQQPLRILCAREYQTSIRDSVHHLLAEQADAVGLGWFYEIQQSTIKGKNGSEFIFKGLRRNVAEVKSTEAIDICWVEEAEAVSDQSWQVLIPTIRKPGSEIWISFNPALETDPTYQRFVVNPPNRSVVRRVTYNDVGNLLPDVLREEAEELKRRDPEAYAHVWGGAPWHRSDAQIFAGKFQVDDFTPGEEWSGPYFGADWGFSQDPTVLVRCWTFDGRLYIDHENAGIGWDMDEIARRFSEIPGSTDHIIRADSARPETIHEIKRRGFKIQAAPKWSGSVEDGIAHIRSYSDVVIHPRCRKVVEEFRLYSYEVDKQTGDPLPKVRDAYNHTIDAIRYAIAPLIKQTALPGFY
jgi:phage terminase large subunit